MKRKIINPDIAVNLSIKAYNQAAKKFNKKQESLFLKTDKKGLPATVDALKLKDTHYQLFYVLINYYREKILNLNHFFKGSSDIMTHISPKMSMYVKTGRIAAHLGRANNTIRARLRRLESAGIITVIFHGNKKPLEISFDKNTCLIFDKNELEYIPETKFLNLSKSVFLDGIGIKANHKRVLFQDSIYNNTITKKDVLHPESSPVIQNSDHVQYNYNHTKNFSRTTNTTRTTESAKTKLIPAKNEKLRTVKDIREEKLKKIKEKSTIQQMSDDEKAQYYSKIQQTQQSEHAENLKQKRKDAIIGFSLEFFGYLVAILFPDKYFSPDYRKKTINYIANHYFSRARSIEQMKRLWYNNYKKRIDISRSWIDKFSGPDGKPFDTTYFFPLAYLDVERRGKKILSFANTEKFLKQAKEWEKKNGYNRRTDDDGRHRLNKIARELENGFIDFNTALEKVKSITNDTDEYVKQLHARYFGIYSSMEKA